MRSHTDLEMISHSRGSKLLTPGTYTNAGGLKPFKSFVPCASSVIITVLNSTATAGQDKSTGTDSLSKHIQGGAATTLNPDCEIVCQEDVFTDITVTVDNVIIYY